MNRAPETAIVIVTHNRPALLEGTLETLSRGSLPPAVREILVLENGRRDCGSRDVCRRSVLPVPVRYFHHHVAAKAKTLNAALSRTRASFLIFFDDDVRVGRQCVAAYVDGAARYGHGHFFGGPHKAEGPVTPPEWLRRLLPYSAFDYHFGDEESVLDGPYFVGFNWAAFRSDLVGAGRFPEYLGPGQPYECGIGEETVMQERLRANNGVAIYLPRARVGHLVPETDCSYEFALLRSRRYGIVLTLTDHLEQGIRPLGLPPGWLLRRTADLALRYLLERLAGTGRQRRGATEVALYEAIGRLKGYVILKRHGLVARALSATDIDVEERPAAEVRG